MLRDAQCVVVVPARNEEERIGRVIDTMPDFVDHIIVVDDASTDATAARVRERESKRRITLVRHAHATGVGGAIVDGYREASKAVGGARDAFCVMAGDGQMSPDDLEAVATPIVTGDADYVKGNRFTAHDIARVMPRARYVAGRVFSIATSLAVDHPIHDSQCGFTALSRAACDALDLGSIWRGYGYPNDVISWVLLRNLRITEVPVRPIYAGENSGLRPYHAAVVAALILRAYGRRRRR
jgi:glycosyltransferase involved in cell wall biosynthesis